MNPRVSVILSVYNGEKYIKQAIESILHQTFKDFELIIIDDGSTDNTSFVLDGFNDSRIIRVKNEKNIGLVKSLNKGLNIAKGEFIARMDADDVSVSDRFEKQIAYLDKHKDIGVLGTYMEQVDDKGKTLSLFKVPESHKDILCRMLSGTAIVHASVVMRRNILMSVGSYNPEFLHTEDTELWTRLILKTHFANLPEVLYIRRIHKNSIMSMHSKFQDEQDIKIRDQLLVSLIQKKILNEEDLGKIRILRDKKKQGFLKKIIFKFKNILPVPIRHKLHISSFGKYIEKLIG